MHHQPISIWYFDTAPWRARPKFCLDLRITYDDGSIETMTRMKNLTKSKKHETI